MFAPAGIPKPVEEKLANALKTVLADPEVAAQMDARRHNPALALAGRSCGDDEADEERWAGVIRDAGIKAE